MRKQCAKCPWRKDVDPSTIPGDYCPTKHRALKSTIAKPSQYRRDSELRLMACHESGRGREIPCVGWIANQLGPGNNIALRLAAIAGRVETVFELVGDQHETFEQTLPK